MSYTEDDVKFTPEQFAECVYLMQRAWCLENRKRSLSDRDADQQELLDIIREIALPYGLFVNLEV